MSYVKSVCEREKSSLVLLKLPGGNHSQLLLLPQVLQHASDKLVLAFLSQLGRCLRGFTNSFPSSFHCLNNEDRCYPPLLHRQCLEQRDLGAADPRWLLGQ